MDASIDAGLKIPRHPEHDYTAEMAATRRKFLQERTSVALSNVGRFSLDPASVRGNVENFIGAAQVPIGIAGPLRIEGEHARGDFYVPLATTEGALVASYNRGMRLLTECGGVRTTVVEQYMQRSPVFMFEDALQAREFGVWVQLRFDAIKAVADATTESGKLVGIDQHAVGPLRHLRFNYTTGDAAGQNMTSKATFEACQWIRANYPGGARFLLSGSMETDKKHSRLNVLLTRGKRVVAEAVVSKAALQRIMGVDTTEAFALRQVSNVGAFMAGSSGNGLHPANALTALFIACGQDVACVSESHAAVVYTQLLPNGDYYWSITLPSLVVGTYGGGTALATQRECLELLG
jgi:hydroxymethylglutaryl-CoA reductase (NADPH)